MADPSFLNPITVLSTIGGIEIDVTDKLTENYPTIITENPIDSGSPTTDHVVNLPPRIQIQGGFSDLKISNLVGTLGGLVSRRNRAKNQFDRLVELKTKRTRFDVMDGIHLLKDMLFENLQLTKDAEGFSLSFQADIKGIKVINLSPAKPETISPAQALNRKIIANSTLLVVGSTVERESLLSVNIVA